MALVVVGLALFTPTVTRAEDPIPDDHAAARSCFNAAQEDYFAGRLAEARRGFECAYARLPSAELAWNLARVSERMGDVEQGVRYFRDYLGRAQVSARERKQIEARIQALLDLAARQAVPIKSADATGELSQDARKFFERGAKLYRSGHYKAAAAAFSAALQLSDAPELHYNLAVTAERLHQTTEACDHYRAYLAAAPDAPDRVAVVARIESLESDG
jgi:tetratricopeptide (TPR) repeat protein